MRSLLLFLVLIIICSYQPNIKAITASKYDFYEVKNKYEPGKCYYTQVITQNPPDSLKEPPFVLELIPAQYKDSIVQYTQKDLDNRYLHKGKYRFLVAKPTLEFAFRPKEKIAEDLVVIEQPEQIEFCWIEKQARYKQISKEELIKNNWIVPIKIQIAPSKVIKKYVKKRPRQLSKNQYYTDSNYWTPFQERIGTISCGSSLPAIKKILIQLGYDLKPDDRYTKKTLAAIKDFQQKNGLKVGELDRATLKKLSSMSLKN